MCHFVKPLLAMVPPDPTSLDPRDLKKLMFLGKRFQSLPAEDKYNLVQLMTMSAADFLDQWFETDVLKATMSASGIIGTFLGVRSPGTAYVLLHHYMGEIDGAFRCLGIQPWRHWRDFKRHRSSRPRSRSRNSHPSPGIENSDEGRPRNGVVLESGEEIRGTIVSSSVDPNLTFLKLMEPKELPADFVEEVRRYKYRGSSGKVNLALDALPDFTCLPGPGAHLRGAMSISPSSNTWSAPTTMPSTAIFPAALTSTS